jgi:enamine deaminase RidA (YjgF/YER057c/UK114 family)
VSGETIEARLKTLGHVLPDLAPTHEFLAVNVVGDLAYVSGHAPYLGGEFRYLGKVGRDFDLEAGRSAAQLAVLGCLSSLKEAGCLEHVSRVLKVNGYVHSDPEFQDLPKVTDAASQLLIGVFGECGRHARTTVGVASLPLAAAVEVEMIVQLQEKRVGVK